MDPRKQGSPAFCGVWEEDLYPCGVCGLLYCEAHAGDQEIMLGAVATMLCSHCAQLPHDEQLRIIELRKDLERG